MNGIAHMHLIRVITSFHGGNWNQKGWHVILMRLAALSSGKLML